MTQTRILDQDDFDNIDAALNRAQDLQAELDRARLAGIDVQDKQDRLNESINRLRAIRQAFSS